MPLACHARLVAPALHASGHPVLNTAAAAMRLAALCVAGVGLQAAGVAALVAMAVAWALAEGLAAAWTLWLLRRLVHREVRA